MRWRTRPTARAATHDGRYQTGLAKRAEAAGKASAAAVRAARLVLEMDGLIQDDGTFASDEGRHFAFRRKAAEAVVALEALLGER